MLVDLLTPLQIALTKLLVLLLISLLDNSSETVTVITLLIHCRLNGS